MLKIWKWVKANIWAIILAVIGTATAIVCAFTYLGRGRRQGVTSLEQVPGVPITFTGETLDKIEAARMEEIDRTLREPLDDTLNRLEGMTPDERTLALTELLRGWAP